MEFVKDSFKFVASMLIVLSAFIGYTYMFYQAGYSQAKSENKPVVLYTVDNVGGVMVGEITDKEVIEGRYTVTVHGYGKFLVTKQQYESLSVGDEVPDYLKKRGNK